LERAAWNPDVEPPDLHDLLVRVEDAAKPVVFAIHGTELGGGLELANAVHYRVAVRSARLGLPEANLGIIPGAEGTQRLPRLVGVERAIDMCVTGRLVAAAGAHAAGLIGRLIDGDLLDGAIVFAREAASNGGPHRRTRERTDKVGGRGQNGRALQGGRSTALQ